MRPLREMSAGLPHGCGGQQGSPQAENGTECILCYECTKVCPTKALH
ncbi:4Fe-4S binding protein [Dysosmobacter sp.]